MTSTISRRAFLGLTSACGLSLASGLLPGRAFADTFPTELEARIQTVLEDEPIGFDLRAANDDGTERFRVMHNAYGYYPVASSFKMMVVLYYLLHTPQVDWRTDEESAAYRVAVYSNNPKTGELLAETAPYVPAPGNVIERFNYFLRHTLELQSGIHDWDWENSPTLGEADSYFAPSSFRSVRRGENSYEMENVFFAADLSQAWFSLLQDNPYPMQPQAQAAIERTLELFAISAEEYESPIERVLGAYIGKDGVIPEADSPVGRVVNDAGIVEIDDKTYVVAAMYMGNEYRFVELLRTIFDYIAAYEVEQGASSQTG